MASIVPIALRKKLVIDDNVDNVHLIGTYIRFPSYVRIHTTATMSIIKRDENANQISGAYYRRETRLNDGRITSLEVRGDSRLYIGTVDLLDEEKISLNLKRGGKIVVLCDFTTSKLTAKISDDSKILSQTANRTGELLCDSLECDAKDKSIVSGIVVKHKVTVRVYDEAKLTIGLRNTAKHIYVRHDPFVGNRPKAKVYFRLQGTRECVVSWCHTCHDTVNGCYVQRATINNIDNELNEWQHTERLSLTRDQTRPSGGVIEPRDRPNVQRPRQRTLEEVLNGASSDDSDSDDEPPAARRRLNPGADRIINLTALANRNPFIRAISSVPIHRVFVQRSVVSPRRDPATVHANLPPSRLDDKTPSNIKDACHACEEKPISSIFLSCGHMWACYECAERWRTSKRDPVCPMCRAPIVAVTRVTLCRNNAVAESE